MSEIRPHQPSDDAESRSDGIGVQAARRGTMRVRLPSAVALLWVGVTVACGDPNGPAARLTILSGDNLTDTVGSIVAPALSVRLLGADGQPLVGQTVYFNTGGPVLVAPIDDPTSVIDRLPVVTDANGQASALVEFKYSSGPGDVAVSWNGQSAQAQYTVVPGLAAHVHADPRDTALYVGGVVKYRPYITDAYGNRRPDVPPYQYTSIGSDLIVGASGQGTGAAIGRGAAAVTALGFADTDLVSVVPQGRIAAQYEGLGDAGPGYIVTLNLDGSAFDTVTQSFTLNRSLNWSPLGDTLMLYRIAPDYLASVDIATGNWRRVISDPLMLAESHPSFSHDGSFIYFTGVDSLTQCYGVWRVHADGSALQHVVADSIDCGQYIYQVPPSPDYATSPSPDGTRVAYAGQTLNIRTLGTGADTSLSVVGDEPRWSPTGTWIAYDSAGILMLVHPDGSGRQALVDRGANGYLPGTTWSPDGQWLVYRTSDRLALIEVATGLQLPLATTIGLAEPTWHP